MMAVEISTIGKMELLPIDESELAENGGELVLLDEPPILTTTTKDVDHRANLTDWLSECMCEHSELASERTTLTCVSP